jgi:predicted nucleic acid-binding Zn finger protein
MIEVLAQNKSKLFVEIGMNVDFMLSEGVFVKAKSK